MYLNNSISAVFMQGPSGKTGIVILMREGGTEMSRVFVDFCMDAEDKKGTEDMVDPFYSDANMAYLARVTSEIDSGKARLLTKEIVEK